MPDKSKRRKNNKNKRKNKNNRPETCYNEVDSKELVNQELVEQISELVNENRNIATISESIQRNIIQENSQEVSQDLNNNTNNDQDSGNRIPLNEEFIYSKLPLALDSPSSHDSLAYVVEVPEQKVKNKSKLINTVKSKSLDNDDAPKIVEITEDNSSHIEESNVNPIIDYSNVVIYDTESDVEWEKIDEFQNINNPLSKEFAKEIVTIATLPLDVAQCEETKTLTPEEEVSLRNYLKTLQLSTTPENIHSLEINTKIEEIINQEVRHRLRKKGSADDFFIQRLGPPRVLDVIDEEVSGESSATSRRQSYLSDKKSDIEDLEDDVFESKNTIKDFSTKKISSLRNKPLGHLVQQECILVGAKLKEPEVSEARGDWTMKTVERMTGAEVVYLTDSSSSTSSLHEIEEDTDDGIETDVSIRMVTPTIEVTDTENLLKKTFVSSKACSASDLNSFENIVKVDSSLNEKRDLKEVTHEIVVLSTDDIKTNLYVKDLDDSINNDLKIKYDSTMEEKGTDSVVDKNSTNKKFDLEIKVIKCEINDAFNNLIKEVTSDSETNFEDSTDMKENIKNDNYTRQDSSSSVSSSQCTAKYNPNCSSLNDVSNIQHDENCENTSPETINVNSTTYVTSHVKDVIDCITESIQKNKNTLVNNMMQPYTLKDFCIRKIASLPYGDKVLEELASVSARLQNIRSSTENKTNYKESNLPHLEPVSSIKNMSLPIQTRDIVPPPIKPRYSSLKKSQDEEHWTGVTTNTEPVYVCLSPSQKMLIEKTNTDLSKDDRLDLVNMHNKFEDHTGHYKKYNDGMKETRRKSDCLPEISPVIPLKSQTGSRLLALICDPSITANVNSLKNRYHGSLEQLQKDQMFTNNTSENKNEISNINRDISRTLRPIPLPKPRKCSTSTYERDESTNFADNSFRSLRNEKKIFHFSTGNLNKEIEKDISSIQNLHRFYTDVPQNISNYNVPRRPSLPKDLCDQQMEYIRQKEKEVDAEIQRLVEMKNNFSKTVQRKGPRAPLITERDLVNEDIKKANNYYISHKRDIVMSKHDRDRENHEKGLKSSLFSNKEKIEREKIYSEFAIQMAEREERKQQKVIKITNPSTTLKAISKSLSALDILDSKVNNRIEKEFISKARERWEKLGIKDPETEDERESDKNKYDESKIIEHKIKVIEDGKEKDVQRLPNHLQEFVRFTAKGNAEETSNCAVWRPGAPSPPPAPSIVRSPGAPPLPPPPPVWVPGSAGASPQATRKTFRPVHFEETPPSRRKFGSTDQNGCTSGSESEGRLKTSHSAPVTGFSTLGSPSLSSRLPRAPNPTVTLLQKAREGQIPRGTSYLQSERDSARLPRDRPSPPKGDPVHALRKEYASETEAERSDYERGGTRKMADAQKKVEGIGPTTKEGIPVALRSEVKDPSRWYKKMYDTIHKNKYDDDYVTIRYKNRRGYPERVSSNKSQYAYFDPRSGYLSEPEGGLSRLGSSTWSDAYDSDVATGPRRRTASVQEDRRSDIITTYLPSNKYSTLASARASQEMYKNQPGRIEDYIPGRSSVIDKEAKQQNVTSTTSLPQASPKEKKDITSAILSKSNMAKALKESGYESDSTLIFRRREDTEAPLSPAERRAAYRDLQAGGEPPLRGFRSPAPPRQETNSVPEPPRRALHGSYSDTESPRRYVESDVNIHYRCPVRHDPLPLVPERELARQQAEHMKRLYREQRRTKYLQELQDMQNRRHQDNFTPSQKTVVPLNRYDEADKVTAKALYTFNGQTPRELSFRKGEIIHVRRQIDANWYEGEVHGKIGLFPYNYVEKQKSDTIQAPKKLTTIEGRARAKFDFIAQTNLELPLKKGEVVVLTRRIDQNWWEGRNGVRTGIFPDSYVTVLQEPTQNKPEPKPILSTDKPVASPAAHGLLNGTDKRSMGSHSYTPQPNSPALANAPPATQPLPGYAAKPAQATLTPSDRGYGPPTGPGVDLNNAEPLYVDTNAEAVPYRAMYKYRPQNPDELELQEGDTVYVLEKCDDGWYVGSSQRTGRFGTFPGNYVERI